jgi:hypothetical protein
MSRMVQAPLNSSGQPGPSVGLLGGKGCSRGGDGKACSRGGGGKSCSGGGGREQ